MARRWLVLNILLLATSAVLAFQIVRIVSSTRSLPPEAAAPAVSPAPKEEPAAPRPTLTAYSVIPARNLFNASRSETVSVGPGQPAIQFPALQLHGVVVGESGRTAYLEDPSTKRTHGYRVGDSISTGRIERIEPDRVTISRGEGAPTVEVLLRDPSRPRPAAPISPASQTQPPQFPSPVPGVTGPPPPVPQPGRPLTPGVLRRPGGMPFIPQPAPTQ
ncbi:MAG TPA: type II secretion system protein N [Methylomirabilota bacterium]|nr:type II secretion system protein N [Methylomirabilota bacterium]